MSSEPKAGAAERADDVTEFVLNLSARTSCPIDVNLTCEQLHALLDREAARAWARWEAEYKGYPGHE